MYIRLRVKYHLFLSDFNKTWIFSTHFQTKSVQWEPSFSIRTNGRTRKFGGMNLLTDCVTADTYFKVMLSRYVVLPQICWISSHLQLLRVRTSLQGLGGKRFHITKSLKTALVSGKHFVQSTKTKTKTTTTTIILSACSDRFAHCIKS
jgi:hypothetical protein